MDDDVLGQDMIGSRVRVLFEDPGDEPDRKGKVWKGKLTAVGRDFIELTNADGMKSYIRRSSIISISEQPDNSTLY